MLWFICGIIILLGGIALLFMKTPSKTVATGRFRDEPKTVPGKSLAPFGVLAIIFGVLLMIASTITTVGTKDVGVVTTFGRPTGRDLENGLHFKAPWQKVAEMDGAINPDSFSGNDPLSKANPHGCIEVRIGDSTTACVDGTVRWRVVPKQASVLYQDYRSDDVNATIRKSLVVTQFTAALNDVLGTFDPLEEIRVRAASAAKGGTPNTKASSAVNLDQFSGDVKKSVDTHLSDASKNGTKQIEVVSVTLSFIHFANSTQDKINDLNKEVGATRVSEQREQTASAQARANRTLSNSVSNDPNVLVSKCFDAVEEAVKTDYRLPAGFSCWQGGGSAVVVPSSK